MERGHSPHCHGAAAGRGLALATLALAAFAPATGQGAVRWYTNDYEAGLEAARKTGRPMVIIFHPATDKFHAPKKMFESDQLAAYHPLFVFIYNDVTVANNTFAHGLFNKYNPGDGQHRLPIIFFADTDEKVVSKIEAPQRAGDIAAEMASVLKKLGGPTNPRKAREAQETLERGNAFLARKHYGAAAKAFKDVLDLGLKLPATEAARAELAKLEETARSLLAGARADIADKAYAEAVRKLGELDAAFSPMPAAAEAREELAKLRKLPEVQQALDEAAKRPASAPAPGPRSGAPRPTSDPEDVENDYFTEAELDALDQMAAGEEPVAAAKAGGAAAECRRLLGFARGWIANKQHAKAREALEAVIEKHPDTIFADQARALLEQLK